ncbi:hypothetical protein IQ215_05630 [Cyanobacterium stanieri LEGE 03274]|uniref:Uncharacterized protein n=1 Tax=Cyanobacterium stanieri LEGE 03274 TaxID=1828756 RepID=A0ABR9V2T2_9CHRO|nr:hypothetical protein [Cyanobacterium stanieri]MBE9222173.1 hypothetical protein [Cyanobacterium stanieri LEGE 03274]
MKNKLVYTTLLSLGLVMGYGNLASAQNINSNQDDIFQSNEQNSLYGDSINPMQLIHNANMMNRMSGAPSPEERGNNIRNAAQSFRERQLQRMMEMEKQNNNSGEVKLENEL